MFSSKRNLFRINFIVFFFRESLFFFNFFLCRFSFLVSLSVVALMFEILCRSMFFFCFRTLWFWSKTFEFDVFLCCRFFEKQIRCCFCLSRTLLCFNILLFFAHSENSFFDVFEKFFNSIINVKIWNMCSKELIMNKENKRKQIVSKSKEKNYYAFEKNNL